MAQNLELDPVRQDYIVINGSPVPTDRVLEACYYPMLIPQNNWLYVNPGQGSLLYTLEGIKRAASVEQQFAAYTQQAIQSQVIATGKATASQVTNLSATRTASSNQVSVIPSNVQLSSQLSFNPV
jgi:hypothetical protein